jgi:Fe-S cluster assembly scaffold protein SufB
MHYDTMPDAKDLALKVDSTLGLFAKAEDAYDIVITVNDNVTFNLYTLITCIDGTSDVKIHINCGSDSNVNVVAKNFAGKNGKISFTSGIEIARQQKAVSASIDIKNYLLHDTSEISSNPDLWIYSKDVSCSHGCTMSTFDNDQLFYMNSRGIEKSKEILVEGYIQNILDKFPAPKHLMFKQNINHVQELFSSI